MARLNKKSTKAAIVKLLKENESDHWSNLDRVAVEEYLLKLAQELELDIKPEDYRQ